MSIIIDNAGNEIDVKDLLEMIVIELKLLNARIDEAFETGIEEEDVN